MPRPEAAEDEPSGAEFAGNLIGFARLLRRAGLPVGPAESLAAAEALSITGIAERDTVRAALRATLLHAHDHHEVFDGAFDLWWRAPGLPLGGGEAGTEATERLPAARRLAEALAANRDPAGGEREDKPEEASLSVSAAERLGQLDFEAMSAEEIAAAKREIRRLALPLAARPTRRFRPDPHGPRSDLRATVRALSLIHI